MQDDAPTPPRDLATQVAGRLRSAGHIAYWAGGCVRDALLGKAPKDYDIATDATPDQVMALFPASMAVGKAFGVVIVPMGRAHFEVATFRSDHAYRDGRHPDGVTFTDARSDANRRDFTVNALFQDPSTGQIHDYVGGRADLEARVIRCVGDPSQRFAEDHLRLLRAARFSATLGFSVHPETADAIRRHAELIKRVSPERIRDELTRLLVESPRAGQGLVLLADLGLLPHILPEVTAMAGQEQPPEFHPEGDVLTHTVLMLDRMESPTPALAYAVLLHDVGKPLTARRVGDRIRFDNHAAKGAELAERILRRLRHPTAFIGIVTHCIGMHMRFGDVLNMKRSTLRRMIGEPTFELEMALHRLDCQASHGKLGNHDYVLAVKRELDNEPVLPTPWVSGRDVLALGVAQGPAVGQWVRRAYDAQLEGTFDSRDPLLEWLGREIARA